MRASVRVYWGPRYVGVNPKAGAFREARLHLLLQALGTLGEPPFLAAFLDALASCAGQALNKMLRRRRDWAATAMVIAAMVAAAVSSTTTTTLATLAATMAAAARATSAAVGAAASAARAAVGGAIEAAHRRLVHPQPRQQSQRACSCRYVSVASWGIPPHYGKNTPG